MSQSEADGLIERFVSLSECFSRKPSCASWRAAVLKQGITKLLDMIDLLSRTRLATAVICSGAARWFEPRQ
jgi:hypothetical protein